MSTAFPINDSPRFAISTATAAQTVFSVPFPFQANGDVAVYKVAAGVTTLLTRPTHYSLSGAGSPSGGSITLVQAAVAGHKYIRVGQASLTRVNSIVRNGRFDSVAADDDFDRLTLIAQEQARELARTVRVPLGETGPELAIGADNSLVMWDAGNLVAGPDATALEHIEAALAVEAGRALVYPGTGPEIYAAGGRQIGGLAEATEADQAVTLSQLAALEEQVGVDALLERIEALEAKVDLGWQVGDLKMPTTTTLQAGWLKTNGQTIGDEDSGGTARANADTEDLFAHLWASHSNTVLAIQDSSGASSTRGADAATDYAAHKRLPLPSLYGEFMRVLDEGGSVDAGRSIGTAQANEIEAHTHTASSASDGAHQHNVGVYDGVGAGSRVLRGNGTRTSQQAADSAGAHTHAITVNSTGGTETRPRNKAYPLWIKL